VSPYFDVWSKGKETIKKSVSRNIRFIQAAISVVKSTHLKPYSCKYSKKTYTQHQILVLILFKYYLDQHYRELIEDVGDMAKIQEILNLSIIPHFTTLRKLLRQCHAMRASECYVMDRGYDSDMIHHLIRENLHADAIIPIRSRNNEIVGGTYRPEMVLRTNNPDTENDNSLKPRSPSRKESSAAISKHESSSFR
jgi:hypothetical protein